MADDVTTGELARTLEAMRRDTSTSMHGLRNEMTIAIGKLDLSVDEMAARMADTYVNLRHFEEVRRGHGERVGDLEDDLQRFKAEIRSELKATTGDIRSDLKTKADTETVKEIKATLTYLNRTGWTGVVLAIVIPLIVAVLVVNLGLK